MNMRARYNDARALGVPAIDAVRYAVHRNLCLCIKWHWRTGLEVAVRRDASAATPSE